MITLDTLGDLRDLNPESALVEHIDEASRLVHGYDFDDCQIRSREEMGEAAGLWELGPEQMAVRADMLDTPEGQQKLTHVLVHEAVHAGGVLLEGFTEAQASWLTGESAMAYHSEVRAAHDFFRVVGREKSLELAREENPEVNLLTAYVQERVHQVSLAQAVQEGQELLEAAK